MATDAAELLQARRFRVLLAIEMSRGYGRACIQGVAEYARTHGPWTFLHVEREPDEVLPRHVATLRPDGVIARLQNEAVAAAVARLKVPTVDLLGRIRLREEQARAITSDAAAGAAAVFEHFHQRGHSHFAFCGYPGLDFSDNRCQRFTTVAAGRGLGVAAFSYPSGGAPKGGIVAREREGEQEIALLGKWVRSLPRPVAIFACNDNRGRQLLDACALIGARVPEEVAVVGVDNDPAICETGNPPLSSLDPNARGIGYEGAAMLHRLMRGLSVPPAVRLIPPLGVVVRHSSDSHAVSDAVIAAAMHAIREQACGGLTVDELAEQVHVSRATLERRFARVLQRTPHDEINRMRLERARQLLIETDYKLEAVAAMAGFCSPAHLSVAFKAGFGAPPGVFRQAQRPSDGRRA